MKTLLLFAFALGLAVSAVPPDLAKFLPNKEYVYDYVTEALTGIPAASKHVAGIKVQAKVHIQVKGSNKFTVALRNVRLCEVMELVEQIRQPNPVTSGADCKAVPEEIATPMLEDLAKPIRFRWELGRVSFLQADASDAYWSVNIKRAILSIFHVNLHELQALPDIPKSQEEVMKAAVPSANERTLNNFYRVMEKDLVGECQTIYALREVPTPTPVLLVTKVRNFDSCVKRPVFQKGVLAALDCPQCSEKLPLRSQAHANYTLAGNRENFVIKAAEQHSHFIFKPMSSVDGQAITITYQKLALADVVDLTDEIPVGKNRVQKDPFEFEWPTFIAQIAAQATAPGHVAPELVAKVEEDINQAVAMIMAPETSLLLPDHIAMLVVIMKKVPVAALKEVLAKVLAPSADEVAWKKKELVLELLPMTGRPDIAPLLSKLVTEKKVSTTRAAYIVNILALTAEPSPALIKELLTLYPVWKDKDAQLARSIVLAAGALTNTLNKLYMTTPVPEEVTLATRAAIVKEFKALWDSASAREEKLLVLKALGNAGLAKFVPILEPIVADKDAPADVRAKAIYAMRKITPLVKHRVHQICLPIILTPEEPLDVRIAALLITLNTRPEAGVFTMIVQQLAKEPSIQFENFAWTTIKGIAQSNLPCNRNVSEAAGAAIGEVYTNYKGMPVSKAQNWEYVISYIHHLGAEIALDMVTPAVSALPETVVTRVNAYFAKSMFNVMEIGIESKGLLTVLRNLFGPENQFMKVLEGKMALADIVSPIIDPSALDIEKIKAFLSSITERQLTGLAADIYFKVFGHELRFFTLDNAYIKEKLKAFEGIGDTLIGKLAAGVPFDILKTIALVNHGVVIPTPVGMPLSLNISVTTVIAAKGSVKLDGISSLAELIAGSQAVAVNYEIAPKIVSTVTGSMGVELGLVSATAVLKANTLINAPIKGALSAELPSYKVKWTSAVPSKAETILRAEVSPSIQVLRYYPSLTRSKLVEIEYYYLYNPELVVPISFELPIGQDALGTAAVIKGKYAKPIAPLAPLRFLCMPHEFEIALRPAAGAPKFIELVAAYIVPGTPEASQVKEAVFAEAAIPVKNSWFRIVSSPAAPAFEDVVPNPSIASPVQRQVILSLHTKGQAAPKQLAAQVTLVAAAGWEKIQADIQVAVVAPSHGIGRIDALISLPQFLIGSAPLPTTPEELASIKIACGPIGQTTEYLTMKTLYKVLPMTDVEYIRESIQEAMKNWPSYKVETGYEPPSGSKPVNYRPPDMLKRPIRPLQLIFEVGYTPISIPREASMLLYRAYYKLLRLPTALSWPSATLSIDAAQNAPNAINATLTALPRSGTIEAVVKLPNQTAVIRGLSLPFSQFIQPYIDYPLVLLAPEIMKRIKGAGMISGNCSVVGSQVSTFDHVSYVLPETSCETILAQDCSGKKLFRITLVASPVVPTKKIVNLTIGADVIEIAPTSSWRSSGIAVKVNGTRVHIPENAPVELKGSADKVLASAVKTGDKLQIAEKTLGIAIETDGHAIHVNMPMWFSGQVCGMCGNFDTEKLKDVTGPKNEVYPRPEKAIVDYIIPSPTCNAAELKKKWVTTIAGRGGACDPVPETVYIEELRGAQRLACFSESPVPACPATCPAAKHVTAELPFACLPASSPEVPAMIEQLKAGPLPAMPERATIIKKAVLLCVTLTSQLIATKCAEDAQTLLMRQVMAMQTYMEEKDRSGSASGIKQIRVLNCGTKNYFCDDHTGKQMAAIHNHANNINTIGMGEVTAVLYGVEFRTRHNDYKLNMPHRTLNGLKDSEPIPFPDVPP